MAIVEANVEYGAGRGTLGRALAAQMIYQPIEFDQPRPAAPFQGVVLANEFLDALPVHRVVGREGGGLAELLVTADLDDEARNVLAAGAQGLSIHQAGDS